MANIIRFISIQLFSILLFSKVFAQNNELPNEVKIEIYWSHYPEMDSLNKLATKSEGQLWKKRERFILSLFRVSFERDRQFGRAIGKPIAIGKTGPYDFARLRIVPLQQIFTQNVGEIEEAERKRMEKGKEIAGIEHGENIQNEVGVEFELRIKLNSTLYNQIIIKRLKKLPNESQMLICNFDANPKVECHIIIYDEMKVLRPERSIFFHMMDSKNKSNLKDLQKIECTKLKGEFLNLESCHFRPNGVDYLGPICPSDEYTFHFLLNGKNKRLFYECDEAIYMGISMKTNIYQLKNIFYRIKECKLLLNDDVHNGKNSQGSGQKFGESERQIQGMEPHPMIQHATQFLQSAFTSTGTNHHQHSQTGTQSHLSESSNVLRNNQEESAQFLNKAYRALSSNDNPGEEDNSSQSKMQIPKEPKSSKDSQRKKIRVSAKIVDQMRAKMPSPLPETTSIHGHQSLDLESGLGLSSSINPSNLQQQNTRISEKGKEKMPVQRQSQHAAMTSIQHGQKSLDLGIHFRLPLLESSNPQSSKNASKMPSPPKFLQIPLLNSLEMANLKTQQQGGSTSQTHEIVQIQPSEMPFLPKIDQGKVYHGIVLDSLNIPQPTSERKPIYPFQLQKQIRRISTFAYEYLGEKNEAGKGEALESAQHQNSASVNVQNKRSNPAEGRQEENMGQFMQPSDSQVVVREKHDKERQQGIVLALALPNRRKYEIEKAMGEEGPSRRKKARMG